MKCHFCDAQATLCFSNWPDPDDICLCEKHCTDDCLQTIQRRFRENGRDESVKDMLAKARKAS